MNQVNRKIFFIAIPVVLLLLWFSASWYATKKAEERLDDLVFESGARGLVQWEKIKATPLGKVTLSGVSLNIDRQRLLIKQVVIKGVTNSSQKQAFDLTVDELSDGNGHAPAFLVASLAATTGRTQIEPMNLTLKLNADYKKDQAFIDLTVLMPDLLGLEGQLSLQNIQGLAAIQKQSPASGASGLGAVFARLALIENLTPVSLELSIEDKGGMKRFIELQKRYVVAATPGKSADKEQRIFYDEKMLQLKEECLLEGQSLMKNPSKSCDKLYQAFVGKTSKLNLKVGSTAPITVGSMMSSMWGLGRLINQVYLEIN